MIFEFWRSVNLTGNQTDVVELSPDDLFWRSVNLTGNQTTYTAKRQAIKFWRSVNLTGNQTGAFCCFDLHCFGAVSI